MWNRSRMMVLGIALTSLGLSAAPAKSADGGSAKHKDSPSRVEAIPGSSVKQITLTEKGAKRIDIQTDEGGGNGPDRFVPYRAIVYDVNGGVWVYTEVKPLTYVRHAVKVRAIEEDKVFVEDGPPPGAKIVVVGVAELYGAEKGVGH